MEKLEGYEEAQALTGEYETLEPGGYICKIVAAKEEQSRTNKKMLVLAIDILEGDKKDFFKKRFEENKKNNNNPDKEIKWPAGGTYRQMLEGEKATGFFKGLITSLEASNPNFKWDWNEKKLVGLEFGGIFGEEEYERIDGSIGTTTKIKFIRTTQAIQDGKFKIPELKKVPQRGEAFEDFAKMNGVNYSVEDDDLPF